MRKLLLLLCLLMLGGCSAPDQVEDLAFAEILAVDVDDQNRIEVSIQVPKISGSRGEEDSGGGSDDPLIFAATGNTMDEALHLLQWTVPRRLDLAQLELIVVSESLAGSEQFTTVADTIMASPRLFTAARFAICPGSAKEFIQAEKPVIGTRTSSELAATFADYSRNGFIPDDSFAGVYYSGKSVYSDALAIYAESAPDEAKPASALTPDSPRSSDVEMQHGNRYLGAAVMRQGRMVGRLSGEEYIYCKLLRGEKLAFPFSAEGRTVGLTTMGSPEIEIDTKSDPPYIHIGLRFSTVSSSRSAPIEKLEQALRDELMNTIAVCRQMNAEPFGLAGHAAAQFSTIQAWQDYGWHDKYLQSRIDVGVRIHSREA